MKNYPNLFAKGTILEKYPYLLPNAVSVFVVLIGLVVGILFLEETHEKKKFRRDPGLELGRWILRRIVPAKSEFVYSKLADANLDEIVTLINEDDVPRSYDTTHNVAKGKGIPVVPIMNEPPVIEHDYEASKPVSKPTARRAITPQVMLNVVSYGILA